jgi:hypothetical protein
LENRGSGERRNGIWKDLEGSLEMNRGIAIGLASAALIATLGVTALAAPLNPFSVKVSRNSHPGGTLQVQVFEAPRLGVKSVKYTASAVVHYVTGDVKVTLSPNGKTFIASVKVPVGAAEKPGQVSVDVTVSANGKKIALHGSGMIKSVKSTR